MKKKNLLVILWSSHGALWEGCWGSEVQHTALNPTKTSWMQSHCRKPGTAFYTTALRDYFPPLTHNEAKCNTWFTFNHGISGVDKAATDPAVWEGGSVSESGGQTVNIVICCKFFWTGSHYSVWRHYSGSL
jgi:hypothetical protein